jgi:hypothetical protein
MQQHVEAAGSSGSDALCHLRALFLNQRNQWERFWKDHPN